MISPQDWYDYGISMRDNIAELKGFLRVKEEKQLFKQLDDFNDFPVLVFVDIASQGDGSNLDAYKEKNKATIFVLVPALSDDELTPQKELEQDVITHGIMEKFKARIMSSTDGANKSCHFLHRLDVNSIIQEPVYNYNKMNGYSLDFMF